MKPEVCVRGAQRTQSKAVRDAEGGWVWCEPAILA